jgi:hypothetical protein
MPVLIKNIQATVLDNFSSEINMLSITAISGTDDYFKVFGLEGYLQNFTNVINSEDYNRPDTFGLRRNKDKEFTLLEISY